MTTQAESAIENLLTEAQRKYKDRDFASASVKYMDSLERLKSMEKSSVEKYFNSITSLYGLAEFNLQNNDKALQSFCQVLERDPLNVGTMLRRAQLYMKIGEYQKSWDDLQKAVVLEPENHRIEFIIEELNDKVAELKESDSRKYLIKQQISEVIKLPEIQEDMLINFSGLKSIDKQSSYSSKAVVSFVKEPTKIIEVEKEFDMNFLLATLVKQVVLTPEEIMEIEKQSEIQCEPVRLSQEIDAMARQSQFKITFDKESPATQSILKSILGSGLLGLDTISRNQSNISDRSEQSKRVSVLNVKNIDGKVVRSSDNQESDDQELQNNSDVGFGRIEDIEDLGKKEIPVYKNHALKRKSSLRKGASITTRPKEKSMFERGKIDLFSINIDGPIIRHESSKQVNSGSLLEEEGNNDSHRVIINDKIEDMEVVIKQRKQSQNLSEDQLTSPLLGLGTGGLKRKESILKKSKFQIVIDENTEN